VYNISSIDTLKNRVGWFAPVQPTNLVITPENEATDSGLFVNSFHALATVEKVFKSIENVDVTQDTLNVILAKIKVDAAVDVLHKVYDVNMRARYRFNNLIESLNYLTDYTDSITVNASSFTDVIGLSMAIKTIEQLRLTVRSNKDTNSYKLTDADLYQALHGVYTPEGKNVTIGLYGQYREALALLIDVLFPTKIPDGATLNPDGTVKLAPTLKALRIW